MNSFPDHLISTESMKSVCSQVPYCDRSLFTETINGRSAAVFSIEPEVRFLWIYLEGLLPEGAESKHLLWALSFLKWKKVGKPSPSLRKNLPKVD